MGQTPSAISGRTGGPPLETEILATPFKNDRQFKIKQISRNVIAEGASTALLAGKMQTSRKQSVDVALKVFRVPLDPDQNELYRGLYLKELEAAERLGGSEDFILPFLGTSVFGYQPVIVSLYMSNGNLLSYFSKHDDVDRQAVVLRVAEAVTFLHTNAGLVHGDLKCENVLVSDNGTPLLADFGLSALIDKTSTTHTTDYTIRASKTLRFAAPELLSDNAQSDSGRLRSKTPQSDVWAFGMLLVQAFTCDHPWPGFDKQEVFMKILSQVQHPRPDEIATSHGLHDEWWDVCLKCWEFDPVNRPSIKDVHQELARAVSSCRCFGVELDLQIPRIRLDIPMAVRKLLDAVGKHGMDSKTIYRARPSPEKVANLRQLLDLGYRIVDLDSPNWVADVDVVAEVVLTWLRELPEPLIPPWCTNGLQEAAWIQNARLRYVRIHERVNELPDANFCKNRNAPERQPPL
ncbi:kinase-like protein [Auricularia subglabra TFB-10046 SS5]|nr:kinase-like protein [Auricularia subglabra TFB-10046 SS5]